MTDESPEEKTVLLPAKKGVVFWIEFLVGCVMLWYLVEVNVESGGTAIPTPLFGLPAVLITGQASRIMEIFKR